MRQPLPLSLSFSQRPVTRMVLLRRRHGGLNVYHVDVWHGPGDVLGAERRVGDVGWMIEGPRVHLAQVG
jgi:hypothetical protein